jgi:hypothetical protein
MIIVQPLVAKNPYKKAFIAHYPAVENTQLDALPSNSSHCGVCHYDFNGGGDRNLYGAAFEAEPHGSDAEINAAFATIGASDQDGDGYTSAFEITDTTLSNTPTFPGLADTNVGLVVNIPLGELSPYLAPVSAADTTPPLVTLTSPNGGEVLVANTETTITWTATDDESTIVDVLIEESLDNGATYKPIARYLANTGSFTWFPANRPTISALIRLSATNSAGLSGADTSDAVFEIASPSGGLVPTTLRDFDMPGSQPFEAGGEQGSPESCAVCHGGYDSAVEPYANWQGSMMALASLDPLFEANMAIANQDAPDSGDLCLRCHISNGWLQGRSVPTDGSAMLEQDMIGVSCNLCHQMADPHYEEGISPSADSGVLAGLSFPFPHDGEAYGNGMFVIDPNATSMRGPFALETEPNGHSFLESPFHQTGEFCGTCHDVSNPAFTRDEFGIYQPNTFDAENDDFSPHAMAPVERTYSEWKNSAYNTPLGVHAPQFAGNKPAGMVFTCQDCHMSDVSGYGANPSTNPEVPLRPDLPLHDMTGGSTWLPPLIAAMYAGQYDFVDVDAVNAGVARATYMLQNAATLSTERAIGKLVARVTNETGHKLPTGYPEGRRVWVNVQFFDTSETLVGESGAYDASTGVLTHDAESKIYAVHPGIGDNIDEVVGLPPGPSLHFVLNNQVYEDNRIPPRGFTNSAFAEFGGSPVGHSYADGQYWDDSAYVIPEGAVRAVVNLYYQSTSKEFVEFLRDKNVTNTKGQEMYDLWDQNGKCPPVLMASTEVAVLDADGDADKDGLTNIEEDAFGSDPRSAASAHFPHSRVEEISGALHPGIRHTRLKENPGTRIAVEMSTDLSQWDPADELVEETDVIDNLDGTETLTLRLLDTLSAGEKCFLRLRVEAL